MVDKIAAIFLFSNGPDHWKHNFLASLDRFKYANLVILATPARIIGHQVVCLGHLGGFAAF